MLLDMMYLHRDGHGRIGYTLILLTLACRGALPQRGDVIEMMLASEFSLWMDASWIHQNPLNIPKRVVHRCYLRDLCDFIFQFDNTFLVSFHGFSYDASDALHKCCIHVRSDFVLQDYLTLVLISFNTTILQACLLYPIGMTLWRCVTWCGVPFQNPKLMPLRWFITPSHEFSDFKEGIHPLVTVIRTYNVMLSQRNDTCHVLLKLVWRICWPDRYCPLLTLNQGSSIVCEEEKLIHHSKLYQTGHTSFRDHYLTGCFIQSHSSRLWDIYVDIWVMLLCFSYPYLFKQQPWLKPTRIASARRGWRLHSEAWVLLGLHRLHQHYHISAGYKSADATCRGGS